jgi:glycosyltransferase involved in cell wall biosynthesis
VSRAIRVLHAIQNLNYGGMERLFADIVRLLDPGEFESHVLVLGYLGRFGEGLDRHAVIHHAPPMTRASMLRPAALAAQLRSIAPDIVHTHQGVWYKVSLAARMAGVPHLVHTEHGRQKPDPLSARLVARLASRRTDRIVAVSEALAEHLKHHVVAVPDRVSVLTNGVDTEHRRPGGDGCPLRRELGLTDQVPIIGSIGRLEPIKGYDIVVEAYLKLREQWTGGPLPVLVVAGDGSARRDLEARIAEANAGQGIRILGWRDDMAGLHAAFTLFTMGSRSEGTSVSLLEAMSAGLCPVVTDVGGNAAVLGSELRHRLVAPADPAALARAWMDALADPARRTADAKQARERVMAHFSLSAMVRGYAAIYRELMGS